MILRETIIGDCRLLLGDSREILPTLVAEEYAAVVTDPPYGIKFVKGSSGGVGAYRGSRQSAAESRGNKAIVGDAQPFDPEPMLRFGNVLMFGANHYAKRIPDFGRWLAWNKLEMLESFDSFSDVEFLWHSKGKASRICNYMWKGGLACRKTGENNGRRQHPTQKPIGLMKWCIAQVGVERGSRLLDPYMGSGSTGVACLRVGMTFTGIEIDESHYNVAVERIAEANGVGPNSLFKATHDPATLFTSATNSLSDEG